MYIYIGTYTGSKRPRVDDIEGEMIDEAETYPGIP